MTTIAYLGPEHTNTHVAACKRFGPRAKYVHAPTVEDVFRLVERNKAKYGVVPVENSLEGAVTHTLDRFIDFTHSPATIHGEIEQPIRHYLITHDGADRDQLKVVYSHPQALAQCRRWLDEHLPHAVRKETNSTAEAIEALAMREIIGWHEEIVISEVQRAAIGRKELVIKKKLQAIPIPNEGDNKTRFLIISLGEASTGRRNKTSLVFSLKDRPGALYDALTPFKREGINLTKIESRPSKKKAWEYYFFIDLEGHQSEPRVKRALKALEKSTLLLKVLGSYPMTR